MECACACVCVRVRARARARASACGQGRTEPAARYLECEVGSMSERRWAEQLKRLRIALRCAVGSCAGLCWCDRANSCVMSEK